MLLKGYPEGSDVTLLDTLYIRPKKISERKYDDGHLLVLFKDNTTNEKKIQEINNPSYVYYMSKDNVPIDHNLLFADVSKLDKKIVPFKDLEKCIATDTRNINFYWENLRNGNRSLNQKLHTHPKIFFSDMNIEENFRWRFSNEYTNKAIKFSKSFFDIEVDNINQRGDFPEPGECPIDAVTIIIDNVSHTFLLRNSKNPLIEEFEKSINPNTFKELKELIRLKVGGWKNEIRYGLDKMKYNFHFYNENDEIKLIRDLFKYINYIKPDFILVWNMSFDMPYIIERIKKLGFDPKEIICPSEIINKQVYYYLDTHNDKVQDKGDHALISSYSIYLDQMIHFMSRRKNNATAFKNAKLDYIGEKVAKITKLDYSNITTSIAKLPYLNYKLFVFYNIIDVIVQKCIEHKSNDMDYVFNKCLMNNTKYDKCNNQTIYIVNRMRKEFYKDGFILGNNLNRFNPKPTVQYPGAFVANILRLTDEPKLKINGHPVNIVDNCDDYDFKSLYPSITREMNIAHNTQIGRVIIDDIIYKNENRFKDTRWSRSIEFIENFQCHVWLEFGTRWLNLGNYSELYDDIMEYFTYKKNASVFTPYDCMNRRTKLFVPVTQSDLFVPITNKDISPLFIDINDNIDLKSYCKLAEKEDHTING